MTTQFTNIGAAFPLEKLTSDIARNEFNYQSILNGLIDWDKSTAETVMIRLTKDTDPWYEDFTIPSKKAVFDLDSIEVSTTEAIDYNSFAVEHVLDSTLSGGTREFISTTFDGAADVSTATNIIIVNDDLDLYEGDDVVFSTLTGTIPTGINDYEKFTVASVSENSMTFYDNTSTLVDIEDLGSGTIILTKLDPNPPVDEQDSGDIATLRYTVKDNGNAEWECYYYQLIKTWTSGDLYTFGNLVLYSGKIYRVISDVEVSLNNPTLDTGHFELYFKTWSAGNVYYVDDLVIYDGALYRVIVDDQSADAAPPNNQGNYVVYAEEWVAGTDYNLGAYVFDNGNPYVANSLVPNSTTAPVNAPNIWEFAMILAVPTSPIFTKSYVARWHPDVDVTKFVLKNVSTTGVASSGTTDINTRISVKTREPASIYQKSVEIFSTSNYAFWPTDKTSIWDVFTPIPPTDITKNVTERQGYSAVMLFNHVNADIAKTVNFINYDGPDLDQGLCIYLPADVPVGEGCVAAPEDGFTYDFFFRIWPNPDFTQDITRDHVVNKSQIYVYSAPSLEDVQNNTCGQPIAKFSMARVTNFYVFGENIAIPDKPVCYRATFMFSAIEGKWITLDYYQLPDHVFLGPIGFVDPQSPANLDLNNDVIGNINPNAANIGYETGALPLFQDPFSNPDLSPYKITGDDELDVFKNRII